MMKKPNINAPHDPPLNRDELTRRERLLAASQLTQQIERDKALARLPKETPMSDDEKIPDGEKLQDDKKIQDALDSVEHATEGEGQDSAGVLVKFTPTFDFRLPGSAMICAQGAEYEVVTGPAEGLLGLDYQGKRFAMLNVLRLEGEHFGTPVHIEFVNVHTPTLKKIQLADGTGFEVISAVTEAEHLAKTKEA